MLRQLLSRTLLLLAIVSLAGEAWSQTAAGSNGRLGAWMNRPADNSNGAQNTALLPAAQPNGGGQPAAQTNGVGIVPAPVAQNDAGFAFRLGNNVGLRAVPPVTVPPGVGNINHPGIAPMPMTMQPSPTGMPPAFPNINSPGLAPSSEGPFGRWPGHPDGRRGHVHNAAPAFYGIPYYVPYVI
jgi:hypothetical protein